MSGKIGITPARGFESLKTMVPNASVAGITPARGFDSSGLMQKAMDWFSITTARGLNPEVDDWEFTATGVLPPRKGV